ENIFGGKSDVFTLGLILIELCIYMDDDKAKEVFNDCRRGIMNDILKNLPDVAAVMSWLTNVDATKRPNSGEILNHPFFNGN
ncbi:hypothetical protein PMAYCL1PPCAC_09241, partial [Pristionchus mayeri]